MPRSLSSRKDSILGAIFVFFFRSSFWLRWPLEGEDLPGRRWAESCMLALSGTCYSDYAPDKISLTINSALVPRSLSTSEAQMSRERMNTRVHAPWTQALNRAHCCKQRPIWEEAFFGGGQKDTFHLSPLA